MKNWKLVAFILICATQLGVPASMIHQQQKILSVGKVYRFKTAPVDPADPFRGRYVAVRFEAECLDSTVEPQRLADRTWWYAQLQINDDGYTKLHSLSRDAPPKEHLRIKLAEWGCENGQRRVLLPFDRYYMDEALAPAAESAYLALNRGTAPDSANPGHDPRRPAHVTVRVLDGKAALEELYLDGKPVSEYLRTSVPPP